MTDDWRRAVGGQFAAALDMLENAVRACPDAVRGDDADPNAIWYLAYHTLWWLDHDLTPESEPYAPPPPFGLEEMDPAGRLPMRAPTTEEFVAWLARARRRLAAALDSGVSAPPLRGMVRTSLPAADMHLYSLRHVHHHVGQINMRLRQAGVEPPRWVKRGTL